jgi:hypothetical protein
MSEESLFREVDEDLRADRMRALWRRYGPYVIGAAIAVVLIVAVNEGWSWWQQSNAARSSDALYVVLDAAQAGDIDTALSALETVEKEGSGKYPELARFAEASYLDAQGKTEEAIALYDTLAASSNEVRLRELALVLAAFDLVDTGDVGGIETRINGLIASGSPFATVAREALGLAQYKSGDLNAALASFETARDDPAATSEMTTRLLVYITQLQAEGAVSGEAEAETALSEAASE